MQKDSKFEKRKDRKREHIKFFLESSSMKSNLFEDIYLKHNALPELNLGQIDTSCMFLGKRVDFPIMINAITGGTKFSREINEELSKLAKHFNIPMAVGSQTIALHNKNSRDSFKIVREIVGEEGIVLSNVSANSSLEEVMDAIEMIKADGIQLHLNVAQELAMEEGDRNFEGILENIKYIVENVKTPIIVKEVGFGISKEVAKELYNVGVKYIDISGAGGTNFIEIEDLRNQKIDFSDLYDWGIPTALSLLECRELEEDLNIIASGGIKNSQDIVKSLVLGASMIGLSGEILRCLLEGGYEIASKYIEGVLYKTKMLMLLLGKKNIKELKNTHFKIKGELKELF